MCAGFFSRYLAISCLQDDDIFFSHPDQIYIGLKIIREKENRTDLPHQGGKYKK